MSDTANSPPLVSVVMPVHNGTDTIERALRSVFEQTLRDYEIVVVDDASTDDLDAMIARCDDRPIRILRHPANKGAGAARNSGIRAAQGRYIALIDCDDEWLPEYLERQVAALKSAPPEVAASLASFYLVRDRTGRREARRLRPERDWYSRFLKGCNVNAGSGLVVRRDVYQSVGYYDESLPRFEDWDWLLRCAAVRQVMSLPDLLSVYHSGPGWPPPTVINDACEQIWRGHNGIAASRSPVGERLLRSSLEYERAATLYHNRRFFAALAATFRSIHGYPWRGSEFYGHIVRRAWDALTDHIFPFDHWRQFTATYRMARRPGRILIVHLVTDLDIGGAEVMLVKLVTHMDRRRFDNVVISLVQPGALGSALAASGIPVLSLDMKRGHLVPRHLLRLIRLLRRAAILQTWLYHSDLLGLVAGAIAGKPAILWNLRCSDMDMSQYRFLSRIVLKLLVRLSRFPTMVLANSQAARTIHERMGYRPKQWRIIPNGFDTETFRPDAVVRAAVRGDLGVADDAILIGLPARFDPMKDHANFFAAARILGHSEPRVRFVALGKEIDEGNAPLLELIRRNDLTGKSILLGERTDMPRVLNALDIVSLTSAFGEGFPNVLGEAMATGVPCVSTDVGDASLIVGDTGLIVRPRDPEALARAWRDLIDRGEAGRKAAGLAARRRIVETYSLHAIVREYEGLFTQVARRSRASDEVARAVP